MSISSITYAYPIPSVGSEELGSSVPVGAPGSSVNIASVINAYGSLFGASGTYVTIQNNLSAELAKILRLLGYQNSFATFPLDVSAIFDQNELTDANCNETIKAYKYYLREILIELNNLNSFITRAQNTINKASTLTGSAESVQHKAHEYITYLESLDQFAQEAVKKFSSHSVVKTLEVTRVVTQQKEGASEVSQDVTSKKTLELVETSYKDLFSDCKSILKDSYSSLDALRNVATQKQQGERTLINLYYEEDMKTGVTKPTDKYNTNAKVLTTVQENNITTSESPITHFDELTLLDKLKYIILYHKTSGDHYYFPDDPTCGYPCIINAVSTDMKEDTKEIGNLEMFYIGFLVDRDGPTNALASFMEIKATAIRQQIQILAYRVTALNLYIKLIGRGLDLLNKSQAGDPTTIPVGAYMVLRYVGANTARTLFRFTDEQNRPLKDSDGNPINTNQYLVLQYQSNNTKASDSHFTKTNNYLLIEATDEGINRFFDIVNAAGTSLDTLFSIPGEKNLVFQKTVTRLNLDTPYCDLEPTGNVYRQFKILEDTYERPSWPLNAEWNYTSTETKKDWNDASGKSLVLHFNSNSDAQQNLPKELGVVTVDVSSAVKSNFSGGIGWNDRDPDKDVNTGDVWPQLINVWQTVYQTTQENYQAQLEAANQSVSSLQKKMDTFNTTSANFRNKSYSIYNKIVNILS